MSGPLPEEGVLTWDAVNDRAQELLGGLQIGSPASAAAMAHLVDETYGRQIDPPAGHGAHTHRILEVGVRAEGHTLKIDLRTDPCPGPFDIRFDTTT